jgi:hypothetical protein
MASNSRRGEHELSDQAIQEFLRVLESIRTEQMPCNQVFARLDEYVENELRELEAAHLMPLLREHLDMCQGCCDEYEALLSALKRAPGEERCDLRQQ